MDDIIKMLISLALLLIVIGWGFNLILGRGAMEQMVGTLAADVIRFLFLLPFRILRWLLRQMKLIP